MNFVSKLKKCFILVLLLYLFTITIWFILTNTSLARYLPSSTTIINEDLQLCYITVPNTFEPYKKLRYCETTSEGVTICNFLDYGFDRIKWETAKFTCKSTTYSNGPEK